MREERSTCPAAFSARTRKYGPRLGTVIAVSNPLRATRPATTRSEPGRGPASTCHAAVWVEPFQEA